MPEDNDPAAIGNVLYPVGDVAAAVDFYESVFGLGRKFVDGDRYAALDGGRATLALAGPAEHVTDRPAASFKVADVQTALDAVVARGGVILRAPEVGPHEVRAVAKDLWSNIFVVYSAR